MRPLLDDGRAPGDPSAVLGQLVPEGIAIVDAAGLEPAAEPGHALPGRAVGPRLGVRPRAGLLLDPVVADRRRRVQRLFDVAGLEDVALGRRMPPDAGEAVGLELEADGEHVRLVGTLALHLADALRQAEHVLYVVADLVGDDVGLREVARCAEPALEVP